MTTFEPGPVTTALLAALPREAVRSDTATRIAYGYDNSRRQAMPAVVVFPTSTEEVAITVRACIEHRTSLTARGLGSATTGAAVPLPGGVVLSFERMNRVLEVAPDDRLMVVEPGVLNAEVQRVAAEAGFFWPPDPTSAPYSTIGGNLACNAAGPRAVKYGTPRENTLGLVAVTGTGERVVTGTRTTKGVVGYDLTRLIIGSEGTLALITEATIKLTPLQPLRATLRAAFTDPAYAAHAVADIMAGPVTPCALEFMDGTALDLIRAHSDSVMLPQAARALLLIECDGDPSILPMQVESVARCARNPGLIELERAESEAEIAALWSCRRALSPAQRTLAPDKINEDVVVPVSRLPDLLEGIRMLSADHDVLILSFGHAGNGNLHVNLLGDNSVSDTRDRMQSCLQGLFALVLSLGGTLSGEHGIGTEKRAFVGLELDPYAIGLMRGLKHVFDPHGVLNPGKVLPDA